MSITDEKLWMKIALYASKSITDSDRTSSAFFLSINSFFIIIISTADFFFIWFNQTKFRQHFFLSSISYRSTFQQLTFFDQMKISSAFLSIIGLYRLIFLTADLLRSNENLFSTSFYHRFIQINFFNSWFFSDQMRASLALLFIIDSYRPDFDSF